MWRELGDLAQRTGQAYVQFLSMWTNAILATLDGRLEDTVPIGQHIAALGGELGLSSFARVTEGLASMRPMLYLGNRDDALQFIALPQARTLCLAHLGLNAEVAATLEQLVVARPTIGSKEDETEAWRDMLLLEAAVLVRHRGAAGLLLRRFAGSSIRTTGHIYPTCIPRHLGAAASLLCRHDEARAHYRTALDVCQEMRFRPELALTRLQLAELLLEHYPEERAEALEHLNTAIAEFRDMKMQPSLELALRHRSILNA